jgi:hypothetical protein
MLPDHLGFAGGETLTLVQIGLFSLTVETNVFLQRKLHKLEGGVFSTVFACENKVRF